MEAEKRVPLPFTREVSRNSSEAEPSGCCARIVMTVFPLLSALFYLIDVGSDINVAYKYYREQDVHKKYKLYFKLTLTLLLLPAPVLSIYSAKEYNRERKKELSEDQAELARIPKWRWGIRTFFTLVCLSRVSRFLAKWLYGIQYIYARYKGDEKMAFAYLNKLNAEKRINGNLRILEVCIEAGPQLFLQLLIFYHEFANWNDDEEIFQLLSITTSIVSLAWALATSGSLVQSLSSKGNAEQYKFSGYCILFLAHLLSIVARAFSFMLLIDFLGWNVVAIWVPVVVHVFFMFLWHYLMETRALYSSTSTSDRLFPSFGDFFIMVLGAVVSLFSYMHNYERLGLRSWYWAVCLVENTIVLCWEWWVAGPPFDFDQMAILYAVYVSSVLIFVGFHKLRHRWNMIIEDKTLETVETRPFPARLPPKWQWLVNDVTLNKRCTF